MANFNNGLTGYGNFGNMYSGYNYQPQQMNYQRNFIPQNDFQNRNESLLRIVESENNVSNIDVPMDGNAYFFIKADGSEIYSKMWTKEMKTKINKYVLFSEPEVKPEEKPSVEDVLKSYFVNLEETIYERFESLDNKISSINKPVQQKPAAKVQKEESK